MSFLNAGLAGFLALTAIPIIIYLINRQRYQRVPWAAMEFLLRAMRKNRKRLRLENLLLLILRTLIVLLFVLGMMRPFLESNPLTTVGNRSRAELIIIDRSYSMGLKEGQHNLLFLAVEEAKRRINDLGKGDRLGLMLGGGTPERLLGDARYISDGDRGGAADVLEQLEGIDIVYESLDVAFTLQDAAQWIREKGAEGGWTVHLYTDLQRRDWMTEESSDTAVSNALKRLQQIEVPVVVHQVGKEKPRNASILDLSARDRILAVDLSTAFQVTVENRSSEPLDNLEIELWVNDNVQGSRKVSLDPAARRVVSFPYVFRETGLVRLQAVLLSDGLEEDNIHYGVEVVRESVSVAIVDGGYRESAEEAAWLEAALAMGVAEETGIRLTPYETRVIPADRFPTLDLAETDVIVFATVRSFAPGDAAKIEGFLEKGGGIFAFVGPEIDIASYVSGQYRDGEGWFPFAPRRQLSDESRLQMAHHWEIVRKGHPALSFLAENESAGMGDVLVNGYIEPRAGIPEENVLLVLDVAARTPMLVEKAHAAGNVLVMNTGADRKWSNFPVTPAYVCFLHELLPYLAARGDVIRNLGIGEAFSRVVASEEYATRVLLISPEGDGVPLVLDPREDGNTFALEVRGQASPGNYEIRFGGESAGDAVRHDWFSVNADPDEGILQRILPEEVKEAYPESGEYLQVEETGQARRATSALPPQRSGEIWRSLFWVVLIFMVMESALARYFGRRRVRMPS